MTQPSLVQPPLGTFENVAYMETPETVVSYLAEGTHYTDLYHRYSPSEHEKNNVLCGDIRLTEVQQVGLRLILDKHAGNKTDFMMVTDKNALRGVHSVITQFIDAPNSVLILRRSHASPASIPLHYEGEPSNILRFLLNDNYVGGHFVCVNSEHALETMENRRGFCHLYSHHLLAGMTRIVSGTQDVAYLIQGKAAEILPE